MSGKTYTTMRTNATGAIVPTKSVPVIPRETTGDRAADQVQQNTAAATQASRARPEGQGSINFKSYPLVTGDNIIRHKLGRKFVHVNITNPTGASLIWYVNPNADPSLDKIQVVISSASNVTADIEVS